MLLLLRRSLATLSLAVGLLAPVHAEENQTLVLATDFWPPFRIDNGEQAMTGIDVDLAALLEKRLKLRIKIVRVPWIRALAMMREGKADLMSGLARTPERAKFILYAEPAYAEIRPAFYGLRDSELRINSYADLNGPSIGFTRGSAYFEPFDSDTELKKQSATDESQLLRMLVGRRFDLIVGSDIQVDYELKLRAIDDIVFKHPYRPERTTPLYIGISRQSPFSKRKHELDRAIADLFADGSLQTLLARYGVSPPAGISAPFSPTKAQ